jgi:hypothetical protein
VSRFLETLTNKGDFMDTENKGIFFPLDEQSYKAVCEVANKQDKTLGHALSLLITEGAKAVASGTEVKGSEPTVNQDFSERLSGLAHTVLWISQELERLSTANREAVIKFSDLEQDQQ